jgi:toxin FitB
VSLVVLDTDVASGILRGRVSRRLLALLAGKTWCVSFVTLGELTKWTILRSWGPRRLADMADWQRGVVLLPFDRAVATTWGELQARSQNRGRPRPVNDTWIAACCLVNRLPLATFNTKDFADFAQYDGLDLLDVS